ncbi:MAG: OmpA family protein [Planctomycetes bacterium]|nr:OmpA family protein [Planctomycetota bacterium]
MADHEHKEEHGEEHGSHGGGGHGGGHGGGGHAEGEHEGAPEWLISFADNVALMMGFFVILLAMNMGPKAKGHSKTESEGNGAPSEAMVDFVIAMRESFNNPFDLASTSEVDQPFIKRIKEKRGESAEEGVRGNSRNVQAVRPTGYSDIGATIPFDNDSELLSGAAKEVIASAAAKLRGHRYVIEIRGHTSPSEVKRSPEKGLELSYRRAMTVARALAEQGVPWTQMRPSAAADHERIVSRTYSRDEDGRNQRVEVILTNEAVAGDPYTREVGGGERDGAAPAKPDRGDDTPKPSIKPGTTPSTRGGGKDSAGGGH